MHQISCATCNAQVLTGDDAAYDSITVLAYIGTADFSWGVDLHLGAEGMVVAEIGGMGGQ